MNKLKKPINILMITESRFPRDTRVRQEAYTLAENNYNVSVIGIKDENEKCFDTVNGVKVYRIPKLNLFSKSGESELSNGNFFYRFLRLIQSLVGYGFFYLYFTTMSFLLTLFLMVKMNYKIIHFHNPPDTLIIIGIFWKLFGKKLVFDHHDLSPDLYLVKFDRKPDLIHKILVFFENISCNLADYVIATNESYKKIEQDRCHIDADKIFIVRNGPNLDKIQIVDPASNLRKNGITNVCYLGDINKQDGLDYLIEVMNKIINVYKYDKIQLIIIGDGDYVPNIKKMSEDYSLSNFIIFTGFIGEQQKLNQYLSSADIFVDTAPDTFLNHSSTFIKLMEYMVFKKPIVSFSLKESMYTLKDAGIFIEPNNCDEMAKSIINLIDNNELKEKMAENSAKRITQFSWDVVSRPLIQLYQKLSDNI